MAIYSTRPALTMSSEMSLPFSGNERLIAWWGKPLQGSTCVTAWPTLELRNQRPIKASEEG